MIQILALSNSVVFDELDCSVNADGNKNAILQVFVNIYDNLCENAQWASSSY